MNGPSVKKKSAIGAGATWGGRSRAPTGAGLYFYPAWEPRSHAWLGIRLRADMGADLLGDALKGFVLSQIGRDFAAHPVVYDGRIEEHAG